MADKTRALRQARLRDRERDAGLVRVLVTVPEDQADTIKQLAATLRAEHKEQQP
jgi:hypothetical protein